MRRLTAIALFSFAAGLLVIAGASYFYQLQLWKWSDGFWTNELFVDRGNAGIGRFYGDIGRVFFEAPLELICVILVGLGIWLLRRNKRRRRIGFPLVAKEHSENELPSPLDETQMTDVTQVLTGVQRQRGKKVSVKAGPNASETH